ncbi:RNA polymerase sigma factor [Planctomycetes bacterium Poly30]|uniref:RNA polymerase sigma factor n=1 Tax=Saltatorellus ferox TaxID=2528018 RepID=A0A518EL03_9BACT|nr:RNA polymerase sigma factor [Planctomycetes bacterium Poly30]
MTAPYDQDPTFTRLLQRSRSGEEAALEELMPSVYEELRALARRKLGTGRDALTLQPTALVNEVYLRLIDQKMAGLADRSHFLQLCARVMRNILVDRARARQSTKRDGGQREDFEVAMEVNALGGRDAVDVLMFDEALRRLADLDERKARVVELRYFSGLTMDEVAVTLDVSKRTAEADWTFARSWLKRELRDA